MQFFHGRRKFSNLPRRAKRNGPSGVPSDERERLRAPYELHAEQLDRQEISAVRRHFVYFRVKEIREAIIQADRPVFVRENVS